MKAYADIKQWGKFSLRDEQSIIFRSKYFEVVKFNLLANICGYMIHRFFTKLVHEMLRCGRERRETCPVRNSRNKQSLDITGPKNSKKQITDGPTDRHSVLKSRFVATKIREDHSLLPPSLGCVTNLPNISNKKDYIGLL